MVSHVWQGGVIVTIASEFALSKSARRAVLAAGCVGARARKPGSWTGIRFRTNANKSEI
jgi:hypothetical protein